MSYLAGWGYKKRGSRRLSKDSILTAIANGKYNLILVLSSKHDQNAEDWAHINGLKIIKRIYDERGRGVVVLRCRDEK